MSSDLVIILTALLVSSASALLGAFLLLRRAGMMADAISHAVLPGIVVAFWLFGSSEGSSAVATLPALLGAATAGLLTVSLSEWLVKTGRVKNDAAMGLVFPALFSLGVLGISLFYRNVHLDLDAVLYGEIAYAPLNILVVGGQEWGPESLFIMGGVLILNVLFVTLFYKELKISTFDAGLAATFGFLPGLLHYTLMALVSVTTVGAFQSVGAILIVAFLVIPAATALLLSRKLALVLLLSVLFGAIASVGGYFIALWLDASIAGMMAVVAGVLFMLALLFSPLDGLITRSLDRRRQRRQVAARLLLVHLAHHDSAVPLTEVAEEFAWPGRLLEQAVTVAERAGWLQSQAETLALTDSGRFMAAKRP
jgi:manganese/zinc/iron transport system permease protein